MHTDQLNYHRIEKAIDFLKVHYQKQPSLEETAEKVHLSPYHFQRIFTEWVGISPKQFVRFLSLEHAKKVLSSRKNTLFDATYEAGLSGTGRLHDLFVSIEGMTPGEFKNQGINLKINYSFENSPFGSLLVASTNKGICHLEFVDTKQAALEKFSQAFPKATIRQQKDELQGQALTIFHDDWQQVHKIKLHLKASPFQLKVWQALLKIPSGSLATYGDIANYIHQPTSSRAVGNAIGRNPIAYLIPCHRVIQASGNLGNYRWGEIRKSTLIGWESLQAS
jgi:AraC family transcriptional regulator of adaptative response/methylated-DNA-[protein]-cysteine methyltransferase